MMRRRDRTLEWFDNHIANGLIEGIDSLVQAASQGPADTARPER
jgi:hypothetical protein